jgi:single-stranded-DNA-specific exonuclease
MGENLCFTRLQPLEDDHSQKMKTWLEPQLVAVPAAISEAVGGDPLVSEVLVRRGFTDLEQIQAFLNPDFYVPASPYELQDMQIAIDRLYEALEKGQKICVWGDFDVDGQTATTLLVSALRVLGGNVQYHIPLRSTESHGVNLPVLKEIIESGIDLLLTCDTGISANSAVNYAESLGVNVIITDHHDLPPELPGALAVIDPKRGMGDHPMASLPGVGVAYELAQALFERMGQPEGSEEHLDLVALGIVADLASQNGDVRYLLQRGLEKLRKPQRLGLQMMMELAAIAPEGLTEEHIGFELAPRLNALGRLGDANQAVEFLTTRDRSQARPIANYLEGLNAQRKLITSQVFQAAQAQIEADPTLMDSSALVLANPSWPGGVIGIVASRLVERYNKPALLVATPPGELAHGSARSIPGVDISAAIAAQQDLLEGYGGHPMAAGFSLKTEHIQEFRQALSATVSDMLLESSYEPFLQIDAYLPLGDLSLELVMDLERLAPFGIGNPNLVFACLDLRCTGSRSLGRSGDHLLVKLEDQSGSEFQAVWWGGGIEPLPGWLTSGAALDLAFTARSRDFQGKKEMQIEWLDAHPHEQATIEIPLEPPRIEIIDHRLVSHPLMELKKIVTQNEDILIWAEAGAKRQLAEIGIQAVDRTLLVPADQLVIWTIPPGNEEQQEAIEIVSPGIVHLFAVDPQIDEMRLFVERLLGLSKYSLSKTEGQVEISSLAAATAQREQTIRVGLQWLETNGYLDVHVISEDQFYLKEGGGVASEELERVEGELRDLLAESAAYRRFYSNVEIDVLIEQIKLQ